MRQWFTIRQGITNASGNFSTKSVRGKARYILQWERYHYSIRNGSLFQAETRGPKMKEERWVHDIKGGDDEYHGMIHTAAHEYYYLDRFGLTSPTRNSVFRKQMKIAAREQDGGAFSSSYSHIRNEITFGIIPQIHIKTWNRSSDRVYGTTIHELTHSAHSEIDRSGYNNLVRDAYLGIPTSIIDNNRRLLETWPRTVEIMFMLRRYREKFGQMNYDYGNWADPPLDNLQVIRIIQEPHYTSAGYD